jgi:hypothetical protein
LFKESERQVTKKRKYFLFLQTLLCYHKTSKTMHNLKKAGGGYTTVSPLEARRLAGFPNPNNGFVEFCKFC